MEYKSIYLLQNQYPNVSFYETLNNFNIKLDGIYPQNKLEFTIPKFDSIEVVEETSFKFILAVKETSISDETRYFTSPIFYEYLLESKAESNPYHLQVALDEGLFVQINLDKQIELFNQLKLIDLGTGVKQNQNVFLYGDNSVDYSVLVQYIDWLISKPDPLDNDNNGIIPTEKIADFEIGKYDPNTGEFTSLQDQAVKLENRLAQLEDELSQLEESIQAIIGDIPEEPQKRKTGALEIISLGLGALAVAQGAAAAIKGGTAAFGAAANVAKKAENVTKAGTGIAQQGGSSLLKNSQTISQQVQAGFGTDLIKDAIRRGPAVTVVQSTTNTAVQTGTSAAKIIGKAAKETVQKSKKIFNSVKNYAATAGKATAKVVSSSAKFVARQAGTNVGQAAISAATQATVAVGTNALASSNTDPSAARKKQTDIILKSVAKSAAVEVGKIAAKAAAKKLAGLAVGKILGAAAGPIGVGVMAAFNIVKFFVNKSKEKKEFDKQKKEYDKVMGELERLTKRKEDIEAEIAGILKSGKLKLAREFDERFSSTQKYFQNIGKSIFEKTQPQLQLPAVGG